MNLVLLLSIVIQFLAMAWSLVLLNRLRDWRLVLLTAMLGMMLAPPGIALFQSGTGLVGNHLAEIPTLAVSVLAAISVVFVGQILLGGTRVSYESLARANERRFRSLIESCWDGVSLSQPDGTCTYVSPSIIRILGYSPDEFVGHKAAEFMRPEEAAELLRALGPVLQTPGSSNCLRYRMRHKDGSWRWMEVVSTNLLDDPHVQAVVVNFRDITARKQAECMIREQSRVLDLIFEHSLDCIVLLDKDYNFIRVNQAYAKACGKEASVFPGRNHFDLYPSPLKEEFDEAIRHREVFKRTARPFTFPDHLEWGVTYWDLSMVSIRGEDDGIVLLLFTLRDVTERQRAEQLALENQQRLSGLVESAIDGIISVDSEQRVILFNPAAERLFRVSAAEVLGMPLDCLLPAAHAGMTWEFGGIGNASNKTGYFRTVSGVRRDGSTFPIEASTSHVIVAGQEIYTAILRDITDRLRAEEALTESRDRLELLSRQLIMAQEIERQNLARELHDEIGQTLTAMRMLCETGACPAGPRVLDLVTELMGRVRNLSFDLRPPMLDPLGLLPTMLWLIERYSGRTGIRIGFQHSGVERRFSSELEVAAFRIIQEALTNVARHAGVTEATVQLWADADSLGIQVTDHGKGFDSSAVMATGRTGGLTGMLERGDLLGGEMAIESTPGHGTFLTVQFPLAARSENHEGKR